jgi:hypothetical protein
MGAPTVPYKVMSKGYSITGDVRSGYRATVAYLMKWSDAFRFVDDIFGKTQAVRVGPVTWQLPYRFPVTVAPLYASQFTLEPTGLDGGGNPITLNKGLAPGEYWTHAIVTVNFGTPESLYLVQDDPNGLNQLDPTNPITLCEQSVKIAGKINTHKGGSFLYTDGKPVVGDVGVPTSEARLALNFPRVPYLPWPLVRPYMYTVNDVAILGCDRGTLLLTGMDTKTTVTNVGYGQTVQLEFADNGTGKDWNMLPRNGAYALVYQKGTSNTDANRIFKYKDFNVIFQSLTFD